MDPQTIPTEAPQPEKNVSNLSPKKDNFKLWYGIIATIFLLIVIFGTLWIFSIINKQNVTMKTIAPTSAQAVPTSPTQPDQFAGWKTYDNNIGFSLMYPPNYQLIKEAANSVEFGFAQGTNPIYTYLTVTNSKLTDLGKINECQTEDSFPCVVSKTQTTLDNKSAIKVSYTEGPDGNYDVIQTTQAPLIELKMYVSGPGLEEDFNKILSTFRFTGQNQQTNLKEVQVTIPKKGIRLYIPEGYFSQKDGGYDVLLFKSISQQDDFNMCMKEEGRECNLYSLGFRIKYLENNITEDIQTIAERYYNQSVGGPAAPVSSLKKVKIGIYESAWQDVEGMGAVREIYLRHNGKIYLVFGNSFDNNLNVTNKIVENMVID